MPIITRASPVGAIAPSYFKVSFLAHQRPLHNALREFEQKKYVKIPNTSYSLHPTFGMLSCIAGSGKTLQVLALLGYEVDKKTTQIPSLVTNNGGSVFLSDQNLVKVNVVVVPDTMVEQWLETVDTCTTLLETGHMMEVSKVADLQKVDAFIKEFSKQSPFATVLCSRGMYPRLVNILDKKIVMRVFFDDVQDMKLQVSQTKAQQELPALFQWFISATFKPTPTFVNKNQISQRVLNEIFTVNKKLRIDLYDIVNFKTEDSFAVSSIDLIEPAIQTHIVKQRLVVFESPELEVIYTVCNNQGIEQACMVAGCEYFSADMAEDFQERLKLLRRRGKVSSYHDKYELESECPITCRPIKFHAITPCCFHDVEFEVLMLQIANSGSCPFCRHELTFAMPLVHTPDHDLATATLTTPEKFLFKFLEQLTMKSRPFRVVLFAKDLNSIKTELTRVVEKFELLLSSLDCQTEARAVRTIRAFQRSKAALLMVDQDKYGFGLNMQNMTHMILFHGKPEEPGRYEQLIGRGQRYGRLEKLKIHILEEEN